jgi:hypothetical protein
VSLIIAQLTVLKEFPHHIIGMKIQVDLSILLEMRRPKQLDFARQSSRK